MVKNVVLVVLLLSSPLWCRNSAGVADGSDWKDYSQDYKVGWIDGFVTAMSGAQIQTGFMCVFQLKLQAESAEFKACTDDAHGFDFEMIKFGQYLEGMDAFYKDFRNRDYPINGALK